jgi:hypothetical protein
MDGRGRVVEVLQQVGCTGTGSEVLHEPLRGTRREEGKSGMEGYFEEEGAFVGGEDGDGDGGLKCIIICMPSSEDL